ncbi:ribosomal protein L7/L12 [Pyxidicoccus trucidator]|uniref:ribosomal protein L7/L12 n=1 Tax=Pyxidicoccus trucidator TaxID=2709662 RepID=UPI0013D96C0A|nr:ribosomal protein L7/L12 [Pyxidicoccus trucidator]
MMPGPVLVLACPRCGALHRCHSLASGNTFGAIVWTDGWRDAPMLPLPPLISRCAACHRFFWVGRAERRGALGTSKSVLESATVVTLESVGKRRVEVMHLVRRAIGEDLQEVKRRIDRLPTELGRYFHQGEVRELAARFEALGARVTLREEMSQVWRSTTPVGSESAPRVRDPDEAGFLEALAEGLAQEQDEERELRLQAWWAGNEPYRQGTPWVPFSQRSQGARDNLCALVALCAPDDVTQRLFRAEALRELERFDEARDILSGEFPAPLDRVAAYIRELATQRIAEVQQLGIAAAGRA